MDYADDLIPEYTVRHLDYGITAQHPVFIWSLLYNRPTYRVLHYDLHKDHPGQSWGPVQHLTAEWDHVGLHDHDYCEIALIRGGSALHRTPHYTARLQTGDVLVASPGHIHALEELSGLQETHLAFLPEWLADDLHAYWSEKGLVPLFLTASLFPRPLYPKLPQFHLEPEEMEAVDQELLALSRELARPSPSLVFLKLSLMKCLVLLARAFVRQEPEAAHVPFRQEVWSAMVLIEACVRQGQGLKMKDVASRARLSHRRLDAIFKEATGTSPTDYYMRRRVQWAAHKLLAPEAAITRVALDCGYADAAHFSNAFRRYYGISPREYRRLYAAGDAA